MIQLLRRCGTSRHGIRVDHTVVIKSGVIFLTGFDDWSLAVELTHVAMLEKLQQSMLLSRWSNGLVFSSLD